MSFQNPSGSNLDESLGVWQVKQAPAVAGTTVSRLSGWPSPGPWHASQWIPERSIPPPGKPPGRP